MSPLLLVDDGHGDGVVHVDRYVKTIGDLHAKLMGARRKVDHGRRTTSPNMN